ncbi:hypothetical protein Alches_19440 [Alicyclobacillus hesperidum subsp. aegles]|uniref:glycoside hydrolase family 127 protein n=1 Tax=Alicyclobacillus hesperidum TaxID=89784 RepID=UPI00058FF179|nr:beta-L-arabinofuranosidase domain-containing protein [Alicyclobacillus hesperidum]GLG01903.1 hypothetical protein Alches_19440 [Alicyclobacillus hesperidum subsp. aegles]
MNNLYVQLKSRFWSPYQDLVRETVLPYQLDILSDNIPGSEPSGAIRNFRIAAGLEKGNFTGMVFQDSDVAKWIEAVGHALRQKRDPDLEVMADKVIDLVVAAQRPDGYLNTYFTIQEPGNRWTNLMDCHELYCAGHMIEAGVAYFLATGKRKLLDAMCKFADYIADTFGSGEGKIHGYDGHQEIELALVKLYIVTKNTKYLDLAKYFIDARGTDPNFLRQEWESRGRSSFWGWYKQEEPDFAYHQAHKPVRDQQVAVGHAVRAMYMYTAMADIAQLTCDQDLKAACERLWNNVTKRQMYITGGIGSTSHGEAFTFDYDLPNETAYAETCASIGLIFFANRMIRISPRREYADVMERALYNVVIGSMALDGKHYCYVNPLALWPPANIQNPDRKHVKPVRQAWFGCACCPPNVARLMMSLGDYIYTIDEEKGKVYVHLYIGSEASFSVGGRKIVLIQDSEMPWQGRVKFRVALGEGPVNFSLALRIPSWCADTPSVRVNGNLLSIASVTTKDGYIEIERTWTDGDVLELDLPMRASFIVSHPQVRATNGMVAIERGPIVYCVEEADNGANLAAIAIDTHAQLREQRCDVAGVQAVVIDVDATRRDDSAWPSDVLYRPLNAETESELSSQIRAIPYFLWGNRGSGEMAVWLRSQTCR